MKIIVQNLAVEYSKAGDGPVALLMHGWGDSKATFAGLVPLLAQTYTVITLDLPGFGASETPHQDWAVADFAGFVAAFIAKLDLSVDLLVGHSLGGRIAIKGVATGKLHPRRLVLIASAGLAKSNSARNRAFKAAAKVGKVVTALPPLASVRLKLRSSLYQKAGSDYLTAGAMSGTFLRVIAEDLSADAANIHVPTLLIWGDADTETPIADGQRLHGLIKNSHLAVITGAGHFVHQSHAAEIFEFIESAAK